MQLQKIVRANNEYKYDSYIDAINYLVQADEIHREDVSELVDAYFPKKERPMSRYNFMLELEISNISTDDPGKSRKLL